MQYYNMYYTNLLFLLPSPFFLHCFLLFFILLFCWMHKFPCYLIVACHQISNGVTVVFGPVTSTDIKAITTVTTGLKIPLYSSQATNPAFAIDHKNYPLLLRMDSSDDMNTRVLVDVFKRFLWKRVAVLSSNSEYGTS